MGSNSPKGFLNKGQRRPSKVSNSGSNKNLLSRKGSDRNLKDNLSVTS